MFHREEYGRFVITRFLAVMMADDQESGHVIGYVLYLFGQNIESI